jgi:CubicO group peptidase (beta-lactamase class C family)
MTMATNLERSAFHSIQHRPLQHFTPISGRISYMSPLYALACTNEPIGSSCGWIWQTHRLLLVFISLLALASPALSQTAVPTELQTTIHQVDHMATAEWEKDKLGSVTVGIVRSGGLVWTKSYGYADMDKKSLANRDTVYRIGSITKQFTALMLLQLVQDGKVHLADPVEKYLPEVNQIQGRPTNAPPITLVQLATMTAGIATEPSNMSAYLKGPVSEWDKVMKAALPHTRYVHEPGTHYRYSNIGYAILGAALSRAAGQPYVSYVQEHILGPLGMTQTAFEPNARIQEHIARGYAASGSQVDAKTPEREHQGRGYKVPNGAMYSTVDDLARFVAFELGGGPATVLKTETLDDNYRRVMSATGDLSSGYGIGFNVSRYGGLVVLGHTGAVAGYQAEAIFERHSDIGVILLRNVSGGKFNMSGLARQTLEKLAPGDSRNR